MIYHLYGARLDSAWPLPYSRARQPFIADISLTRRPAAHFTAARIEAERLPQPWAPIVEGLLPDGRTYLQWPDRFEFLISPDGRRIDARPLRDGTVEGFHTHLLGQALSFALIRHGVDPLHATVVTAGGGGIGFLGHSGYGKSTLAASFVASGHQLLTDDLLVVTEGPGGVVAHPGAPRLKLFPQAARRLLPGVRGTRMMRGLAKLLFPLEDHQVADRPVPLRALYVLVPPRRAASTSGIRIRRLTGRQACLALIRNTFNASVCDPDRLARQLGLATTLAAAVPVKALSYPRSFGAIAAVRAAVLADLGLDSRA